MIPLSKTLDPADYADLTVERVQVNRYFASEAPQHDHRKWEYALALRAFDQWGGRGSTRCVDVGGAGSPFWRMLPVDNVRVIDPHTGMDLASYLASGPSLTPAVFCLSVLEHVEDLDQFLYHLSCLVAPGGLLVLTMDCCDCVLHDAVNPDQHHFHWMRRRIFTEPDRQRVLYEYLKRDFTHLGEYDALYHGHYVYDYSFASLAMVKRA